MITPEMVEVAMTGKRVYFKGEDGSCQRLWLVRGMLRVDRVPEEACP